MTKSSIIFNTIETCSMGITEIVTKQEWASALDLVDNYDFYHTYDYHAISCGKEEQPVLLKYEKDDVYILLPLILRQIPDTDYYDFTSVYGYAGPLKNDVIMLAHERNAFHDALNTYFKEKSIISVFSRLHPYIEQSTVLEGLGVVTTKGKVVNIDITLPLEESRRAYSKSNKNQINKLRRECEVIRAQTKEEILEFVDIYYENMKRLNADDHYFFSEDYFLKFMEITDFQTDVLLVRHKDTGKFIAGSMFVKTKDIIQFHLSGSRTEFLRLKPSKLFLDEMRVLGTNQGYKIFNLGGGLGGAEDSLFEFKASFSKEFKTFELWKYIINETVYEELSQNKGDIDYFPKYRAK